MNNCPKGTHFNPDAESCLANLTPEQFLLCLVAAVGIVVVAKLISKCRRNRQN